MEERHEGPIVGQNNGLTVIDCQACGFYHLDPLPTPEALETLYRDEYYTSEKPTFIPERERDGAWWRAAFDRWLEMLEQEMECWGEAESPGRALIDIGCGPGSLMLAAVARGWRAQGLEPSTAAAEHAIRNGLHVTKGSLEKVGPFADGCFDAAVLTGVLEHVRDPARTLELARGFIRPGGRLLAGVPRDFSPLQLATGLPSWWIHHTHCSYFSRESFWRLLGRCGFEVLAETTSFPMEWFLLMGDDYISNPSLGPQCHAKRIALERGLGPDAEGFYRSLAAREWGREIVVVARRRP
jgi:SAM-dependent methyltransferase